jgi:ADP-dependent NAD(P)H-hydrate dehydratase / NAD(P)H-hydrate epimerase
MIWTRGATHVQILTSSEMQAADRYTIERLKIPALILMENAGRCVAEVMSEEVEGFAGKRALVVCGAGHNGGDGFVVARHLAAMGVRAHAWLVGARRAELRGDAAVMAEAWAAAGGVIHEIPDNMAWAHAEPTLAAYDLVVDALFGTGLSRPLEGLAENVVRAINARGATVVAVDVPSGLLASSPEIPGAAVRADLTVTFARPKIAHLVDPAEALCGVVHVVDIGVPDRAIEAADPQAAWITRSAARALLPREAPDAHKGTLGSVLVVAGSVGRAGAAALTSMAALTGGTGLVTAAVPSPVRAEVAGFAPELMTEALPAEADGTFAAGAKERAMELLERADALALGPGAGLSASARALTSALALESPKPVVLDADGLTAFAGALDELARHRSPLVMTPHPGEAAKLLGWTTAQVQADRPAAVRRLARATAAVCVLKGHRTLIADATGQLYVCSTGNSALATGGSGDVLTGLIASLIAQKMDPLDAARLAVFWHGLAADVAITGGETVATFTATGILAHLAKAWRVMAE